MRRCHKLAPEVEKLELTAGADEQHLLAPAALPQKDVDRKKQPKVALQL